LSKWQPRVTSDTASALLALGPYTVPVGGYLVWEPAPGFEWPWGPCSLSFSVDARSANDADYQRLLHAWQQVCSRQQRVQAMIDEVVFACWIRMSPDSLPTTQKEIARGQIQGCRFSLSTSGPGQVGIEAYIDVAWDEEHGIQVDLIRPDDRLS